MGFEAFKVQSLIEVSEDVNLVRTHYKCALAMLHKHEEVFFTTRSERLFAQAIRSALEEPYERFEKYFSLECAKCGWKGQVAKLYQDKLCCPNCGNLAVRKTK